MRDFRDIKVWKKSYDLTLEVYKVTQAFVSEERYALTSQMRREVLPSPPTLRKVVGGA
jgi:hypothetical protein